MRLLLAAIVATLGLASVQPRDQADTIYENEPGKIQRNFFNFFNSIGKNDGEQGETYRTILEEETRKEKQAFDSMKDELRSARQRNVNQRRFYDGDSHKDGEGAVLKRKARKTDRLSNVSASSRNLYTYVSKDRDPTKPSSSEELRSHLKRMGIDVEECSEDLDDNSDSDYDSREEASSKESRRSGKRVAPAKAVERRPKKAVSEDYSSDDDSDFDDFEDVSSGSGDSDSSPKKAKKPKKTSKPENGGSKKPSHHSSEAVEAEAEKAAPEDNSNDGDDDSDVDEYGDYNGSDKSDSRPKEPKKPKKPKKTVKQKKEELKKERERAKKYRDLTSAERWQKRLEKEERRKAWSDANNVTYINKTWTNQGELSSSERWARILAKEERKKMWLGANNITYVNLSLSAMEEAQARRQARMEREEYLKKKTMERRAKGDYSKKKRPKKNYVKSGGKRPEGWTESQERFHKFIQEDSGDEDSRPSRPRTSDGERRGDRRDGDRGRGYDRSRESGYRGNRRYDSSYERRDDRRPDRNNRYRDDGRRGPSRYDSNRGSGYGRGSDRRSDYRGGDRGRGYSRERYR